MYEIYLAISTLITSRPLYCIGKFEIVRALKHVGSPANVVLPVCVVVSVPRIDRPQLQYTEFSKRKSCVI